MSLYFLAVCQFYYYHYYHYYNYYHYFHCYCYFPAEGLVGIQWKCIVNGSLG